MRSVRCRLTAFSGLCLMGWLLLVFAAIHAGPLFAQVFVQASTGDDVKDIETFVTCLNDNLTGKKGVDISSDAVIPTCLPRGCTFVLTMSPASAQAACTLGGCQLPRVIFDCPTGKEMQRFRPSFLLC